MESAPQSTINHNAVIEFASDTGWPHALAANAAGAQEGGQPCPKGRPQIGPDHAKIASPAQRRGDQKSAFLTVQPPVLPRHFGIWLPAGPDCPNRAAPP